MDIDDLKECSQDSLIKYGIKAFAADKIMKALLGSMSQSVGGENLAKSVIIEEEQKVEEPVPQQAMMMMPTVVLE